MGRPSFIIVLSFILLAADLARGHGGTYRGPDGAAVPRHSEARCHPSRPVILSATKRTRSGPELTHAWDWWWEHNALTYLEARARLVRDAAQPRGFASPASHRYASPGVAAVYRSQIRAAALPVLRIGLTDPHFDVRAASAIAIGKIMESGMLDAAETVRLERALLSDTDREVRESTCLALGLSGDTVHIRDLLRRLNDDPKKKRDPALPARRVLAGQPRAFAAIGLGLIGTQLDVDDVVSSGLIEAARRDGDQDVRVLATIALGAMRSRDGVPELRRIAVDADEDVVVRAHAIVSLGKLSDKGFAKWLLGEGLEDESTDVQRSSAIALGLIASRTDEKAVERLIKRAQWASDRPAKDFAIIALGQIGSPAACKFLLQTIASGAPNDRTFAALALGIYSSRWKDRDEEIGEAIVARFLDVRDEIERGAYAIGLGLAGYEAAIPRLASALRTSRHSHFKSHVAMALGLLGAGDAAVFIRGVAKDTSDPDAQGRARKALGLLGDPDVVPILLDAIRQPGNDDLSALGGAAVGLGFTGRKEAVLPLCEMLTRRETHTENTRAFAAVALGCLGDRNEISLLGSLRAHYNYLATTEGLRELMRIY